MQCLAGIAALSYGLVSTYTACLVDVFDTVLSVDFAQHNVSLAERAGVAPEAFAAANRKLLKSVVDGSMSIDLLLKESLRRCGSMPSDEQLTRLVMADGELLRDLTVLHDDAVPFLESLRAKGIRTAFVSNCGENTRPLLDLLGLSGVVDDLVLSCEVGAAKPEPAIFEAALERLEVPAGETLFVDDQQAYCDGAVALGIHAVRIARFDDSGAPDKLTDLLQYF